MVKELIDEIALDRIKPLFNEKRLAEYFGYYREDGTASTDTIRKLLKQRKLPPPDLKISNKSTFWRPETIERFVKSGGIV